MAFSKKTKQKKRQEGSARNSSLNKGHHVKQMIRKTSISGSALPAQGSGEKCGTDFNYWGSFGHFSSFKKSWYGWKKSLVLSFAVLFLPLFGGGRKRGSFGFLGQKTTWWGGRQKGDTHTQGRSISELIGKAPFFRQLEQFG